MKPSFASSGRVISRVKVRRAPKSLGARDGRPDQGSGRAPASYRDQRPSCCRNPKTRYEFAPLHYVPVTALPANMNAAPDQEAGQHYAHAKRRAADLTVC